MTRRRITDRSAARGGIHRAPRARARPAAATALAIAASVALPWPAFAGAVTPGDRAGTASGPASSEQRAIRPPGGGVWLSFGALTGFTQPAAGLADYQWDTSLREAWGAMALAGRGRWATGPRLWRMRTTQRLGIPGTTGGPAVRSTSVELVTRVRLASAWGGELLAGLSGGRMHLGYDPDEVTIASVGGSGPLVVRFAPVDEWIAGGGLSVRRPLPLGWSAGLEVEHRVFGLDTAHRNGSEIEQRRETFGEWSMRLECARRVSWR